MAVLFLPLLVTAGASFFAYAAITGLRLPAAHLVAGGALVLQIAAGLTAIYLTWFVDLPEPCTEHPNADTALVLGLATAVLGGVAFAGTLAATNQPFARVIIAFFVVPLPYVVIYFSQLPGGIC